MNPNAMSEDAGFIRTPTCSRRLSRHNLKIVIRLRRLMYSFHISLATFPLAAAQCPLLPTGVVPNPIPPS